LGGITGKITRKWKNQVGGKLQLMLTSGEGITVAGKVLAFKDGA